MTLKIKEYLKKISIQLIYSVRAIPVNIIWEGETELVFSVSWGGGGGVIKALNFFE